MTDRQLRRLKRVELLDMLIEQGKLVEAQTAEVKELREKVADLEKQLAERKLDLEEAGSLAEASIRIAGVFEAAQEAAMIYLDNLRDRSDNATATDYAFKQAMDRWQSARAREAWERTESITRLSEDQAAPETDGEAEGAKEQA